MNTKTNNELIGLNIRNARLRLKMSQDELSKKIGLKPRTGTLSRYERGEVDITSDKIQLILKALHITPKVLFEGVEGANIDLMDYKKTVPLYSWVQAGKWEDFTQMNDDLEYIELPLGLPTNTFAVRVKGYSMTRLDGACISDGCIVFCTPVSMITPEDLNNKVVIAQYRDSVTIKEFVYDGEVAYLKPWNPNNQLYPIIPFNDEVRIVGIVTMWQYAL